MVLTVVGCTTLGDIAPPPCGPFELVNEFIEQAGEGGNAEPDVILEPPYVAVMGARTTGGNQIASLRLAPSGWASEALLYRQEGPATGEYTIPADELEISAFLGITIGTPGEYVISYTGEESGCRTQLPITVVADDVLRAYDVKNGLSQPPPPDMGDRDAP